MASSLPQPMVYYPSSSSNSMHTQPASGSKGSFGPVFAVLAVISFLAFGACIVGRLCARRLSKTKSSEQQFYSSHAAGGDPEKGFEMRYPTMKPIGSSRAMIHDIEDGFEIKFPTTAKPAAWKKDCKGDNRGHAQFGMPKDHARFKYPDHGVAKQAQARGATFISAKPSI